MTPPVLLNPSRFTPAGGGGSDIFTLLTALGPKIFWKITETGLNYADSGSLNRPINATAGSGNAPTHNQASIYGGASAGLGKSILWPGGAGTSKIYNAASGQSYGAGGVGHTAVVVCRPVNAGGGPNQIVYGAITGDHLIQVHNGVPYYTHARTTGTFYTAISSVGIADGATHIIVGRTNATTNVREIFVDGVSRGTITGAGTPRTSYGQNLVYGYDSTFNTFNGHIACSAVFDKLLSNADITALAASIV